MLRVIGNVKKNLIALMFKQSFGKPLCGSSRRPLSFETWRNPFPEMRQPKHKQEHIIDSLGFVILVSREGGDENTKETLNKYQTL